jgi:FkbM family methyltransferase
MKSKILFDAYFKNISLFWANLPYNLNWLRSSWSEVHDFLQQNPLNIADVGARGGKLLELEPLKQYLNYYAFDADEKVADEINKNQPKGYYSYTIFPNFIGESNTKFNFNIYKLPAQSSVYKPAERFKRVFGGPSFGIKETFEVSSKTLDEVLIENKAELPDMLKLDTQGNELNIIMNSPESLKKAVLIETEVEFMEIYEGQYLYHDVAKFMHDNGFEILFMNRAYHNRDSYHGESKGQLLWGDALFGRREDKLQDHSDAEIAKYIILLINYGHLDFAHHLCMLYPNAKKLIPNVEKYFKLFSKSFFSNLKRAIVFQYDKLINLMLTIRRTNKNIYDDDRSFPKR